MFSIEVNTISKAYDDIQALSEIDLKVSKGELFGLIGPDGAGKTSLIRILTTLLKADRGTATINGKDIVKHYHYVRENVGYMPGVFGLYRDLTVEENLNFFATVFGGTVQDNYKLIEPIYKQIEPFKNRRAGKLSGGMKQKLALSCALIHRPDIVFLDEPTTGVDAVSRQEFWEMLKGMKKHGITVFVSTPYMDEAILCDQVALIQNGRIMDIDKPQNIVAHFDKPLYKVKSNNKYRLLQDLRKFPGITNAYPFGEFTHVIMDEAIKAENLETYLLESGHTSIIVEKTKADIEDRFIDLMTSNSL